MTSDVLFAAALFAAVCGFTAWVLVRDVREERQARAERDARTLRRREMALEHDTMPGPYSHGDDCGICRHQDQPP